MLSKDRLLTVACLVPLLIIFVGVLVSANIYPVFSAPVNAKTEETTAVTTVTTTKPTEVLSDPTTTESKPVVTQSQTFPPIFEYTEEELDLLARLIYSEGGIESYQTQLMIGSVVMNRVSDPDNFPDTILGVIYQENQFSVTTAKIDGVVMIDRPADEEAKKAAYEILTYGSILPPDVQVFYEKSITTGWVASRKPYKISDNTQFSYIYKRSDNSGTR